MRISVDVEGVELSIGGVRYLAVPIGDEAPTPKPAAAPREATPREAPTRKAKRKYAKRAESKPRMDKPDNRGVDGIDVASAILGQIARKPMSSGELIEATGIASQRIYATASALFKAGTIGSQLDPVDGTRRYVAKP